MESQIIISCSEIADLNWRWLEGPLADTGARFEFVRAIPHNVLERQVRVVNLARVRAALEAVRTAERMKARMIVTHGPTLAAWCGLFARLRRLETVIIAHNFNFTELPGWAKRRALAWMLSRADRLVVFSTFERTLYTRVFYLPEERFEVVLWGVKPPEVDSPETAVEAGEYVCAIGGNARDYATLLEAARRLPQIRLVLVVRPGSLKGLQLPDNVAVHVDLPLGQTMNVLMHSRFMALPLLDSRTPCGHVTLVAAMHLGKAFIITDSAGVSDYVVNGSNALTVPAGSPADLAAAAERLWNDPVLCQRLGENGRRFAQRHCSEEQTAAHFRNLLVNGRRAAA